MNSKGTRLTSTSAAAAASLAHSLLNRHEDQWRHAIKRPKSPVLLLFAQQPECEYVDQMAGAGKTLLSSAL